MIQSLKDLLHLGLYYYYLHFISYCYFLAAKPSPLPQFTLSLPSSSLLHNYAAAPISI